MRSLAKKIGKIFRSNIPVVKRLLVRKRTAALVSGGVLLVGLLVATYLTPYSAPSTQLAFHESGSDAGNVSFMRATVLEASDKAAKVHIHDGDLKGSEQTIALMQADKTSVGATVLVTESGADDELHYYDQWRTPLLIVLMAVFGCFVVFFGDMQGFRSLVGLFISVLVVGWFIVPAIFSGGNAFLVCLTGAFAIAIASITIAHGWRRRTFVAVGAILLILLLVAFLARVVTTLLGLTGVADETSYYLSVGQAQIDMKGVLAGSILIAALGVLDDVATTQVAAVDEMLRANPKIASHRLYKHGSSIGKEHIASLVNTLALAYIGASLPVVLGLVQSTFESPLVFLNGEYIATEVLRTLLVSIGLVLAVPLSTLLPVLLRKYLLH